MLRWFANSMVAAAANSALVVVTAAMAAYPLARMRFRGRGVVFGLIVATLFVPPVILIIPNYLIVGDLKWLDTLAAVIVPTAASAFGVFFLRQFFLSPARASWRRLPASTARTSSRSSPGWCCRCPSPPW